MSEKVSIITIFHGDKEFIPLIRDNYNHFLNKDDLEKLSLRYSDEDVEKCYSANILNICGDAGTIIFEDTHGLHKGTNVLKGKRFVLQLVYGVSTYYYLKNNNQEKESR